MSDVLWYKGYLGEIEIDFEDDCIYVSVCNAPGLNLIAEGPTPKEAIKAFRSILDDYLESAEEMSWRVIEPVSPDDEPQSGRAEKTSSDDPQKDTGRTIRRTLARTIEKRQPALTTR